MESLPLEMFREILQYLESEDLLQVKKTSRKMQNIANHVFWSRYWRDALQPSLDRFRDVIRIIRSNEREKNFERSPVQALGYETRVVRDVLHHWGKGRKQPTTVSKGQYPSDFDAWDVSSFLQNKRAPTTTSNESVEFNFGKYFEGIADCQCHDPVKCSNLEESAGFLSHDYCWGGCRWVTEEERISFRRNRDVARERWLDILEDFTPHYFLTDHACCTRFYG